MNADKIWPVVVAIGLLLVPSLAEAKVQKLTPTQQTQFKKLKADLKHIKNGKGTTAKTISIVKKLLKLDPKHALKYYNQGVAKLRPGVRAAQASRLAKIAIAALQRSGLPASLIARLIAAVEASEHNFNPPPPPPPPYQASLHVVSAAA
jgi:septal ring factor EnvC (AmiA/AmiB activator)